jgi:hypothetical protein
MEFNSNSVWIGEFLGNNDVWHWIVFDKERDDLINRNTVDNNLGYDGQPIRVSDAMKLTGLSAEQIIEKCYPGKTPGDMPGHYYLRMYAGEGTGIFHRGKVAHEYRMMHSPAGVEIVVTTHGAFPIYPYETMFDSSADAWDFLSKHLDDLNALALPAAS